MIIYVSFVYIISHQESQQITYKLYGEIWKKKKRSTSYVGLENCVLIGDSSDGISYLPPC